MPPAERITAYLAACAKSRDFQRFGHLAWAGPNVTQRDVEQWIRSLVAENEALRRALTVEPFGVDLIPDTNPQPNV